MKYNLVFADYHKNYLSYVNEASIDKAIEKNTEEFLDLLKHVPRSKINYAYGEGKWTIKQLLQHIIDTERVFGYRILRLARFDATPLPGFDENQWAANANVSLRKWKDMVREFKQVRKSNAAMIADLHKDQLAFTGMVNNHPVNVAALCYIMAGHVRHHLNILRERYLIH